MTPFIVFVVGFILALICSIIEATPVQSQITAAVVKFLRVVGLIMFAVGLFLYFQK